MYTPHFDVPTLEILQVCYHVYHPIAYIVRITPGWPQYHNFRIVVLISQSEAE